MKGPTGSELVGLRAPEHPSILIGSPDRARVFARRIVIDRRIEVTFGPRSTFPLRMTHISESLLAELLDFD